MFQHVMPMDMQSPNIKIHCVMPLYMEVVMSFKFEGLNEEIIYFQQRTPITLNVTT